MSSLRDKLSLALERERLDLASGRAYGFLATLGLASGLLAGGIIVAFRYTIELLQRGLMPDLPGEAFEWLDPWHRMLLPAAGGLGLGLAFWLLPPALRTLGVVHVLQRMHYHQGYMSWKSLVVQFLGGSVALATGQSVGREGQSVHLGAGSASLLGRRLKLPNNAIRTLVACGSAAGIAASFNTPLAGVVFAMEVIIVEYTIAGFVPVILAAVAATAVTRAVFGEETIFTVPLLSLASLWELAYITLMGVIIGVLSSLFVGSIRTLGRVFRPLPIFAQLTAAGCGVGALGFFVPQTLGLGYDTVDLTLAGQLGLSSMALILATKFLATALCSAARMPGGLIGPTVMMGCLVGACFAKFVTLFPGVSTQPALYAMLGMGAMMGAVLQAPLAALLALLEMTANPYIIMPGMLAVVSANLTAKIVFDQDSVFTVQLRDAGLDYRHDAITQGMQRVGVAAVMNRSFEKAARTLAPDDARALLKRGPQWIIVEEELPRPLLLRAADVARYCEAEPDADVDLLKIPAERVELAPVDMQATLFEASGVLREQGVEALYVRRLIAPLSYRTFGIVRRQDVEEGYAIPF